MELTDQIIQKALKNLRFQTDCFIDGKYQPSFSNKRFNCISSIDSKPITTIASGDSKDIDCAVHAARESFESGIWKNLPPSKRKATLLKLAELIEANQLNLALLETLDMGKPIADSFSVDIPAAIRSLRWYAESIDKVYDEVAPTAQPSLATMTREPIGVVGAVVPWNFPLMMAMWKVAPALACGNSVVLKPAEQSSLSALYLGQLANESGIPKGVLNVVPGFGKTAGKTLGLHPDVDCLAFTGSTEVGKLFMSYSAQSNLKKVWLECGGKSPNIIFDDCPDLDKVAKTSAGAIFYNQGEVCTAGSRLIVHKKIKDQLLQKIIHYAKNFKPLEPLNPSSKMGAIVDKSQFKKIMASIDHGKKEGASLILGGKQTLQETGGFYIEPTIFDNVTPNMKIAKEEIFGPVLSILSFETDDEAVKIANDSDYGLAAAVWSKDINRAHLTAKALKSGIVWVNCWDYDDMTTAFGGYKHSGNGRDKSLHSLEKYTELKTTWINLEQN